MIRNNVSPLFAICASSHFLCCHSNMTTTTSTTLPATSDAKNVGPRTSLDHKISATMSVLECIDKMELLSTFLDGLGEKLLSPTSRKEATAISRDLKDAAKVNLTLALSTRPPRPLAQRKGVSVVPSFCWCSTPPRLLLAPPPLRYSKFSASSSHCGQW